MNRLVFNRCARLALTRCTRLALTRCTRLAMGAIVAALAMGVPSVAQADGDLPVGRFGVASGPRQNTGELGDDFGFGWLLGIGAGYQPSSLAGNWSLGAAWEVLWGRFEADNPELVEDELNLLEMNFGLRLRRAMGEAEPRFFVLTSGVTLLRTSVPIAPNRDRIYVGPYAGLGIDQYLGRRYLFSFEARYGLIATGPSSLSLVVSFSFGSR